MFLLVNIIYVNYDEICVISFDKILHWCRRGSCLLAACSCVCRWPISLGIFRFLGRIVNNEIIYFKILFYLQIIKKFPNLAAKLEEFIPLEFLENESEIQGTQVKASKRKGLKLPLRQVYTSTHNDQSAERTPLLPHTSTPKTPYGKKFYLDLKKNPEWPNTLFFYKHACT